MKSQLGAAAWRGSMSTWYRDNCALAPANGASVESGLSSLSDFQVNEEQQSVWAYRLSLVFLLLLYANTPFILPKLEVLRPAKIVAIGTLLAMLSETVFGKRKFEWALPEGGWLIAFMAAAALSCVTALWPYFAVTAVQELAKMGLIFFVLANSLTSERKVRGVMWIMMIGGLFPALGTLHNYRIGNLYEDRASWVGIFANPNEVSYSLVILLPIAAYLALRSGPVARAVLLGLSLIFVAGAYVTFSRGGMLGMVAVVGYFAFRSKKFWLQVLVMLVVIGGGIIMQAHWSRGQDFSSLNNDLSFQQRIITSQAGLKMAADHPALGVGIACSVVAWPLYAPAGIYTRGALITHNTFVQVFSETGLLGGIPFLMFLGTGLWQLHRRTVGSGVHTLGVALQAAIIGFMVCGMSGGYVVTWFPYILYGLAAATGRLPEAYISAEAAR
jgi:O-antigen ligase